MEENFSKANRAPSAHASIQPVSNSAIFRISIVRFAGNYVRGPVQEIASGQLEPPTISSLIYLTAFETPSWKVKHYLVNQICSTFYSCSQVEFSENHK